MITAIRNIKAENGVNSGMIKEKNNEKLKKVRATAILKLKSKNQC